MSVKDQIAQLKDLRPELKKVADILDMVQNLIGDTPTDLTDGASVAWDVDDSHVAFLTLEGNRTLETPTSMQRGGTYILVVTQDATGGRTLAYSSDFKFPGGSAPVLSTSAGAIDILTFVSDGTSLYGAIQNDFS